MLNIHHLYIWHYTVFDIKSTRNMIKLLKYICYNKKKNHFSSQKKQLVNKKYSYIKSLFYYHF